MRCLMAICASFALAAHSATAAEALPPIAEDQAPVQVLVDAGYRDRFAALLDEGFERHPDSLSNAVARSGRLEEMRPNDPRVHYALALIALRNFNQSEAIGHLESAVATDPAYLPAWRALLGLRLKGKDPIQVVDRLYELADVVGRASASPPDAKVREEIAAYIGRVVAFLEGPLGDYEIAELCRAHARNLDVLLGDELHSAYTAGRIELTREHHALLDEEQILRTAAEADKEQKLAEAEERGEELDTQREDVKRTQAEWDAIIMEEVGEIDSQLASLEDRLTSVRQELTTLAEAITTVRVQIAQLIALMESAIDEERRTEGRRRRNLGPLEAQIAACQAELAQYSAQYDAVSAEQAQIVRAGRSLAGRRQRALANYQKATGQAADRIQQLDRWMDKVEVGIDVTAQTPAEDATAIKALRRKMQNWATFSKFNLLAEKDGLLAEYTVVP